MSIQWMDDFTAYGTDPSHLLNGSYAEAVSVAPLTDPDPTAGGKTVLGVASNFDTILRKVLSSAQTTIGVAARYWLTQLPTSSSRLHRFAEFRDVNNIQHLYFTCDASGYLQAYRVDYNTSPALIATSSSPVVLANAWRHMEFKVVLHATAGSVEARVEGVPVLNVSSINTLGNTPGIVASCQNVILSHGHDSVNNPMYVKDYIIWDGSGASNTNFMGSCQVYKIVPDADDTLNWTPSTGTVGWSLINESAPSDDTGYISAAPSAGASTFTLTDLPANVTSVKGVMAVHRSRKTDGGDGQVQLSLVSGANTGNGTDRTITTAYTYWVDVFDKDPGGSSWSKTLVNALKVKLNRTV